MSGAGGRDQRGLATVVGLAFVALVSMVALVGAGIAALVLDHRRAESAADLAALAAAAGYQRGLDPCPLASRIAVANRTVMTTCQMDGPIATVAVERTAVIGTPWQMVGKARAGPHGLKPP